MSYKHIRCPECNSNDLQVRWHGPPVPADRARNQPATFTCSKCGNVSEGRATHPEAHAKTQRGGKPSWMNRL